MSKNFVTVALALSSLVGFCPTTGGRMARERNPYKAIIEEQKWVENYRRGADILGKLSSLGPDGQKKLDIAAYRGQRVAFVGGVAPPGGTNDLITEGGFYLRVVNKEGKDLRPQAAWWEVLVCGEVRQVLPENKIIVIEVKEKDWIILQTG